jgi:hypothetical protein
MSVTISVSSVGGGAFQCNQWSVRLRGIAGLVVDEWGPRMRLGVSNGVVAGKVGGNVGQSNAGNGELSSVYVLWTRVVEYLEAASCEISSRDFECCADS